MAATCTTTSLWWRRLVNTYKVKAGMVCLQCNPTNSLDPPLRDEI